jgi:hypothetical protein
VLVLALISAATALIAAAALVRRRRAPVGGLAPRPDTLPAGRHHLASSVSDLSDLGLHLHLARRSPRPRLGEMLVQR